MKVYKAIGAVSAAMSHNGISKARKNTQQGYNFRGIDDVLNALSTALVEAGLVILPRCVERVVSERVTQKGGALFNVTCHVEFDLVSTEDGSKHTVSTYGEAMDSADKATNKAMSAAYKYLALLVFCIPTEATPETDADFSTHEVAGRDNSPQAYAGRLATGISNGDAEGAASAFYGQDEAFKKAVWACLSAADKKAITAHKTKEAA